MKDVFAVFRRTWQFLAGLMLFAAIVPMASAVITANPSKFIVLDNTDPGFTSTGTWTTFRTDTVIGGTYGFNAQFATSVASETGIAAWQLGTFPTATGPFGFDVFIPATSESLNTAAAYRLQQNSSSLCTGAWSDVTTFSAFDQNTVVDEGQFRRLGTATLNVATCYRLVLSNGSTNVGTKLIADAVRVERLFESKATIPDMPFVATSFAGGQTFVASTSNGAPTIITTLTVTCPANGLLDLQGSGESTSQSDFAGTSFIGLAYSISMNSTATDNTNVVQSSALATFNGDANRDFLMVRRVDACTAGTSITYRLTAYRTTPTTGTASFMWNGRLISHFFPT